MRIRDLEYSHRIDMTIATVESGLVAAAALAAVLIYTKVALIAFLVALVVVHGTGGLVALRVRRHDADRTTPDEVERFSRRKRRAELWAVCAIAAVGIVAHTA